MGKLPISLAVSGIVLCLTAGCRSVEQWGVLAISSSTQSNGGIYTLQAAGSCRQLVTLAALNYLVSDRNNEWFYGTLGKSGSVAVLKRNCDGTMEVLQIVPAGKTPCHLTLSPDEKFLYIANYSSGDITEFALRDHLLTVPPRTVKHTGKSIHKRQKSPHTHFAAFAPYSNELLVCDLGTDQIWIYNCLPDKGLADVVQKCDLPAGSGPRHLAFAPDGNTFFVANELNSTVSSFRRIKSGKWQLAETHSTLIDGKKTLRNYPGAIKMSPDGKYFFVSNRGDDSIAVFAAADNGKFKLLENADSCGQYPSDILLINGGATLLTANLKSHSVQVFEFNEQAAVKLQRVHSYLIPDAAALLQIKQ